MLAPHDQLALQVFRPRTTIEPDGTVEGYASLFGELDAARDMVMPGAFARTLKSRGLRRIPMLFQHDPAEPVGVWLELVEDFRGLRARGRLIPEVVRARELYALVTSGAVDGLSIGFRTVKGRIDPATRVRRIVDLELWEISIVTFPLLAGARVRAVKALSSPPKPSFARARAEQEWERLHGTSAPPRAPRHAAIDLAPRRLKYSPSQPRVPAGSSEGGQWTNGGGSNNVNSARTRLADAGNRVAKPIQTVLSDATPDPILPGARYAQGTTRSWYSVNLHEEEARGGHTLRDHVGKTDEELMSSVRTDRGTAGMYRYARARHGSFDSQDSANDFVNRTLERNQNVVDLVASGRSHEAFLKERFGYRTGREAFRPGIDAEPHLRDTYEVGVEIRYDPTNSRGYRVHTAYPRNERPR